MTYIEESDLNIELAAGLCNLSKRTLQRRLTENNTRYSEVLDRARFRVAGRLLKNHGMSVTEISHRLGYSDVAHFSRAFRRIAGVNLLVYRQKFMH